MTDAQIIITFISVQALRVIAIGAVLAAVIYWWIPAKRLGKRLRKRLGKGKK